MPSARPRSRLRQVGLARVQRQLAQIVAAERQAVERVELDLVVMLAGMQRVEVGNAVDTEHNYAAHKHPNVRAWLDRYPRFVFHFITPTSCSWLNAVEGFFAKLSRRRLKRGVFRPVIDLQVAINRFVAETNADPKPFTWTANPDKIIAAVKRGHQALDSIH